MVEELKKWTNAQKELNYRKFANTPLGSQFIRLSKQAGFPEEDLKEVVYSRGKNDLFAMVLSVVNMAEQDRKALLSSLIEDTKRAETQAETETLKAEVKAEKERKEEEEATEGDEETEQEE